MQIIREQHRLSREGLKDLLVCVIDEQGYSHVVSWNDFAFTGKARGTRVQGEIFDDEIHLEIAGLLEKFAARRIQSAWKKLVMRGDV